MANREIILACGVLLIAPLLVTAQNDPCTVCPSGDPITLPEKALSLPGFEIIGDSCGTLDSTIGLLFQTDSDGCNLVQSASSICGCPIPEGACYLCGEGASVQQPDLKVPYLLDIEGPTPTCEFIEAYLHSVSEADSTCGVAQAFTASYCGCPESPPLEGPMCTLCPRGEAVPDANRTLGIEGIPFETCGEAGQAAALYLSQASDTCDLFQSVSSLCGCETLSSIESPCSLCPDGSPVSLPDEDLTFLVERFNGYSTGEADFDGVQPTCQGVEAFAKSFEEGSRECLDVQFVAGVCGCPPVANACDFCPGEDVPLPDKEVLIATNGFGFAPTCGQIDALVTQFEEGSDSCSIFEASNYICECQVKKRRGLSQAQKAGLAWAPRISAALSIFGSSMIIYDIALDPIKRGSVYHTLMLAMSVIDIFSSTAWGVTTLPMPEYDENGEPTGIVGAKGNEKTCKTQGFFVQLGFTSIFYNMSLSVYFLMVVRYGMKEHQIKKLRLWLHVPALVVGFALAFAGIPLYERLQFGCYIMPPPRAEDPRNLFIFTVVPICTAIVIATVNMVLVYWAVRKQMIIARKWQFGWDARQKQQQISAASSTRNEDASFSFACRSSDFSVRRNSDVSGESFQPRRRQTAIQKMERQTFWQALFYLGAFYVTWPILLVANFCRPAQRSYGFMLVVVIMGPLQGFLNFLVYARPRILKRMEERRKTRRQLQQATKGAAAATNNNVSHRQVQQAGNGAAATSKNKGAPGALPTGFDLGSASLIEEEKQDEELPSSTQSDTLPTGFDLDSASLREEEKRDEELPSSTQSDTYGLREAEHCSEAFDEA
jgi:hypothetical protein